MHISSKPKKKSDKWLFVYQEWWGLNDHIKHQADVFYNDLGGNVNVIALDMYDGKSTTNPQEAGKLMQGVVETRLENIVKGAITLAVAKSTNCKCRLVFWRKLVIKICLVRWKTNYWFSNVLRNASKRC
jgi:dienelactone hydrolase